MFSGPPSSHRSRSFVVRGRACSDTAWPPITSYRTPACANAERPSTKSGGRFIGVSQAPRGQRELDRGREAGRRPGLVPERLVDRVQLGMVGHASAYPVVLARRHRC